jgi:hypothetical protein
MRTFGTFVVAAVFGLAAGCGGGSGGSSSGGRSGANGGQCPASSNGKTCTGEAAYNTCISTACGTDAKACFGANYASGDFTGSPCADYMGCIMKCPCDATASTCEANCSTQTLQTAAGATCLTCLTTLGTCVAGAGCTQPNCTTTTTTTTNTSTGTGCAAAVACCTSLATLDATLAQQCQAALAGQTDAVCAQVVAAYKQAGVCN